MDETRFLKAVDGKGIAVEVTSVEGNRAAVLHLHGFGGSPHSLTAFGLAALLPEHGVDVWRMHFYPGLNINPQVRSFTDVSWEQNLADAQTVLAEMAQRYDALIVVGHSMGGVFAMQTAHPKVIAKVLWDPYCSRTITTDMFMASTKLDGFDEAYYAVDWGNIQLYPKAYVAQCQQQAQLTDLPAQPAILSLEASDNAFGWPKDEIVATYKTIPDSNHTFNKVKAQQELLAQTLAFIKEELCKKPKS